MTGYKRLETNHHDALHPVEEAVMVRHLKRAIQQGEPVLAVNPGGVAPPVVDMLAACHADALFIDCERTPVSIESVHLLARCAQARGMRSEERRVGTECRCRWAREQSRKREGRWARS